MSKTVDELIETLKDIARAGDERDNILLLPVPPGLMGDVRAAAHWNGLSPEGWAIKALYKQSHADKELFVSCGCDWSVPAEAYNPDRKED